MKFQVLKIFIFSFAFFLIGTQIGIKHGKNLEKDFWKPILSDVIIEFGNLKEVQKDVKKEERILKILETIIIKESNSKHKDIWGKDGEYGIVQFKEKTFYWLAKKAGIENPDWKNQIQQIQLLNWALRNGYGEHWSTYKK